MHRLDGNSNKDCMTGVSRERITFAAVLHHFCADSKCSMSESNPSDHFLYHVAFSLQRLTPTTCNYNIYSQGIRSSCSLFSKNREPNITGPSSKWNSLVITRLYRSSLRVDEDSAKHLEGR